MSSQEKLDEPVAKIEKSWYKQQWLLWFSLIIFPPLGVGLTWLTGWSPRRKKITSGVGAAWFLLMLVSGDSETEIASDTSSQLEPEIAVEASTSKTEQQISSRSAAPQEPIAVGLLFPDEMKSESGTSRLTTTAEQGVLRIAQNLDTGNVDGVLRVFERREGGQISYVGDFEDRDQAGSCFGSFEIT